MKTTLLMTLMAIAMCLSTYARIKVEEQKEIEFDVTQNTQVEQAEYVNITSKATKSIEYASIITFIAATNSKANVQAYVNILVEATKNAKYEDQVQMICDILKNIDAASIPSIQLEKITEATLASIIIAKATSSSIVNHGNKVTLENWYEYMDVFESGTGLWGLIQRAKYNSKNGIDNTKLFNEFVKCLKTLNN